ncbi:MAG: sulfatase-like hydrolase/transferase, partial [Verrucomicrobiota bacterium]
MKVRKSVALMNEFIHGLLDPKEAKVMIVFTFLCLGCVTSPVQAAPPVGQTIWLYHVDNGSYLAVDAGNSFQVTATGTAEINSPSELIVEDAGSGYIRFKSVLNGNYIRVNTGNVDKLIADSLDGNDPITHFIWTDLPEGKVRLTSVGDNDDANNLSPNGSAQIVRANNSGSGSVTEFLWGSLTPPPAPTGPPNIVLIYIDDWAWNGTSVPMDNRMPNSFFPSIIEMPNLNAIAANGMVFRNAYGSPQCTPARAAIQTGQ